VSRWSEESRPEREAFWRSHLEGWRRSELNQREYCETHGLPLKRFGNWRAKFKQEDLAPRKLLYRRGAGVSHMTKSASHMTNGVCGSPLAVPTAAAGRRSFSEADKRRIVDEACQSGVTVSQIARRYQIAARVLFRWKDEFKPAPEPVTPTFAPVQVMDAADPTTVATMPSMRPAPPVIVERSAPGIEVELIGGRRVRFGRDTDPETVRRLVALLEERAP
jgi:transposase-like protein